MDWRRPLGSKLGGQLEGELDLQLVGDLSGLARMCAMVECVCLEDGGRVVGGDGGVSRRIGLVGLESWNGKRYFGGRGEVEGRVRSVRLRQRQRSIQ
jgi:hypothetical protein